MKVADLFAGMCGFSLGAQKAGCQIVWAGNHWPVACDTYQLNIGIKPLCQDLHQANWALLPHFDLMLASPCCQGHTPARGKESGNPQHDASRSTAWAVVSATEFHRPPVVIVENVFGFTRWALYPAWCAAMMALGYQLAPHVVDCADLGVPQNRVRLFIVCTLSKAPLMLNLPKMPHQAASTFIDFEAGHWSPIEKPGRAAATLHRVANGRRQFGERFVMPFYSSGSGLTGRSLDRPIGTIPTRDRWGVVDGDRMRMLTTEENLAAMTFPGNIKRLADHRLTVHMAGNAVPPKAAEQVILAVMAAA